MSKKFFQCGVMGWALEILWTSLHSFQIRNPKLTGSSSLWMFPIYGSASLLAPLMRHMQGRSIIRRGLVYTGCIFLVEYISGMLLKRHDACPWDYSRSPWNLQGVIRLDYAPVWFLVGLLFEHKLTR